MAAILLVAALLPSLPARAGTVILRTLVTNRDKESRVIPLRTNLPPQVGTNDIVSVDSRLAVDYDVRNDTYYVHGEIELGPGATDNVDVEIRDIWVIPPETLAAMREQSTGLVRQLDDSAQAGLARDLDTRIRNALDRLEKDQAENSISRGAAPVRHIQVHEVNRKRLREARKDLGRLENLALAAGHDPGRLLGEPRVTPRPNRDFQIPEQEYGRATYRIVVRNTSPTEVQAIQIRRALPPEITPADVLDPDGLEVRRDSKDGVCYLFLEQVDVEPGAERVFNVRIRDKWNVNKPRVRYLQGIASNLLARFESKEKFPSIEASLGEQRAALDAIAGETGPAMLNEEYVAFHRGQSERLDKIEAALARIKDALMPIEKTSDLGLPGKPPTPRTTWRIIFGIIGFLFLLSLLFFFRWFGRSKAERRSAAG